MEIILWIMTFVAITGTILNAKKCRIGFIFWIVSNISFAVCNIYMQHWSQVFLWLIYAGLAIWGWYEWGKENGNQN